MRGQNRRQQPAVAASDIDNGAHRAVVAVTSNVVSDELRAVAHRCIEDRRRLRVVIDLAEGIAAERALPRTLTRPHAVEQIGPNLPPILSPPQDSPAESGRCVAPYQPSQWRE